MNDEFLTYYNRELAYLRQLGGEFAEKHPKIAGRLKMDQDKIEDPHVSRLLEGVAFLTAGVRSRLDDCFPELTDALLNNLYPDYQAPIPSYSIIQLEPKNNLDDVFHFRRGMELENDNPYDYNCSFRACYDLEVWPIKLENASVQASPFDAPQFAFSNTAKSVLKLELSCCPWIKSFEELSLNNLEFFLSGSGSLPFKLYEVLFANTIGIAIVDPEDYRTASEIDLSQLKSKGFSQEHEVIPYSSRSFSGNRLLAEYFSCPEKYLFFTLSELKEKWQGIGANATVYFYLNCLSEELVRHVSTSNVLYACTPIINLFEERTDPILLEKYQHEVQIHPYTGETERAEVHTILKVTLTSPDGEEIEVKPFYRTAHPMNSDEQPYFWSLRRDLSEWTGASALEGFEVNISIVDANFKTQDFTQGWVLNVDTLCTNRNQPASLPYGPGEPKMYLVDSCSELLGAECKTAFSKPLRVSLHEKTRWQLVSHLTLQHFSGEQGLDTLRRTLALYDFKDSPETANFIEGILSLDFELKSSRIKVAGNSVVALGNLISIEFRESHFSGNGVFVFAKILELFFAQYAAINSFIQLKVTIYGRLAPLYVGKPMAGHTALI